MNPLIRRGTRRVAVNALPPVLYLALFSVAAFTNSLDAQTLVYSFETGLEGFGPNGSPPPVLSQSTTGATHGSNAMRVDLEAGATFVGALDAVDLPAALGNPPGLESVLFDLTITELFPANFANISVTVFGRTKSEPPSFVQAEFFAFVHADDRPPGTYPDLQIDLDEAVHPVTFQIESFNEIFGEDPTDLVPTGFQFSFNKSTVPYTMYIDNVRFVGGGSVVTPGDYNGDGTVDAADYVVWRKDPAANGGDPAGYDLWRQRFGEGGGSGGSGAVPEPAAAILLMIGGLCPWRIERRPFAT
jgi:hypothetical protein